LGIGNCRAADGALGAKAEGVDIFVSNDRDFTEPDDTAQRFQARIRVMLPVGFLRDVLGRTSEALEAIRHRGWEDLARQRWDAE
jgi:hypothetical protein